LKIKNSCSQWEGLVFFFWVFGGRVVKECIFCFFFGFPRCSHEVPKIFPKFSICSLNVRNSRSFFNQYSLAMVQLPCTYNLGLGSGGWSKRGVYVGFYNGHSGVTHVPKILLMGQTNGSFWIFLKKFPLIVWYKKIRQKVSEKFSKISWIYTTRNLHPKMILPHPQPPLFFSSKETTNYMWRFYND
jgi:hypothetical protein